MRWAWARLPTATRQRFREGRSSGSPWASIPFRTKPRLDEPTSGLDGKSMRSVGRQIEKLAHEGRVILMITHDVECAVATCDRVLHLRDGRVAQDVPLRDAEELLAAMR